MATEVACFVADSTDADRYQWKSATMQASSAARNVPLGPPWPTPTLNKVEGIGWYVPLSKVFINNAVATEQPFFPLEQPIKERTLCTPSGVLPPFSPRARSPKRGITYYIMHPNSGSFLCMSREGLAEMFLGCICVSFLKSMFEANLFLSF
jgi:hypothetical protein